MQKNISLNDGKIIKLESFESKICLTYFDWKEDINKLLFTDVIYLELLGAIGPETGDLIIEENNKKIFEICKMQEEPADGYKSFKIMDAWDDDKLVEIIAKEVRYLE